MFKNRPADAAEPLKITSVSTMSDARVAQIVAAFSRPPAERAALARGAELLRRSLGKRRHRRGWCAL